MNENVKDIEVVTNSANDVSNKIEQMGELLKDSIAMVSDVLKDYLANKDNFNNIYSSMQNIESSTKGNLAELDKIKKMIKHLDEIGDTLDKELSKFRS